MAGNSYQYTPHSAVDFLDIHLISTSLITHTRGGGELVHITVIAWIALRLQLGIVDSAHIRFAVPRARTHKCARVYCSTNFTYAPTPSLHLRHTAMGRDLLTTQRANFLKHSQPEPEAINKRLSLRPMSPKQLMTLPDVPTSNKRKSKGLPSCNVTLNSTSLSENECTNSGNTYEEVKL